MISLFLLVLRNSRNRRSGRIAVNVIRPVLPQGCLSESRKPAAFYSALTLVLSSILAWPVYAASRPDAGTLGSQTQHQPPLITAPVVPSIIIPGQGSQLPAGGQSSSLTVVIKKVRLQGTEGTGISADKVQQEIDDYLDRPLNFSELRQMAQAVTSLFRSHNMPLAQAVLPPQTLKDGVLTIRVVPGHYDNAIVNNKAKISDRVVSGIVAAQVSAGDLILRSQLERIGLLLNTIPGIASHIVLQPGSISGTSLMSIDVTPADRYGTYLSVDNQGDAVTGRNRAVVGGHLNGLLGAGDQLRFNLLTTPRQNNILSTGLDYSLLINNYATRAGLSYSYLRYRYLLEGVRFSGYTSNQTLYVSHPWIFNSKARVELRADIGQQMLSDRFPGAIRPDNWRRVTTGGLALNGGVFSIPGAFTGFSLRATVGHADTDQEGQPSGNDSAGHFARFNYQLSHLQPLRGALSLFFNIKGQLPNRNMDSSQKFLLGGADGVRAYDTGNGVVDNGYVITSELRSRWMLPFTLLNSQPELSIAAFYDQGVGYQYRDNLNPQTGLPYVNRNNRLVLAGAGLYVSLTAPGNYALTMSWARRTGKADPVSGYREGERLWLSLVKAF